MPNSPTGPNDARPAARRTLDSSDMLAIPTVDRAALVEARSIGRTYGRGVTAVVALASATCTVRPGDRTAIAGPSGSGKSTLLHLLGGLDAPTSGKIIWPALGAPETLRPTKVIFVFQRPSLLAALSVEENVALPLLLGGKDAMTAGRIARATLDRLDLGQLTGKLPEELSGGQAQRVAVARALATRPALILADEPTGQLDRVTAQRLLDVLLDELHGTETALVVATHDAAVTERVATVWRMHYGSLVTTAPC